MPLTIQDDITQFESARRVASISPCACTLSKLSMGFRLTNVPEEANSLALSENLGVSFRQVIGNLSSLLKRPNSQRNSFVDLRNRNTFSQSWEGCYTN